MKLNNKGYTLLEMIMVLFVVSLIMFIMSFNYYKPQKELELKQEAHLLGDALQSMQLKSLENKAITNIKINNQGFECYLEGEQICKHKFATGIKIKTNFENDTISITENGKVYRGGEVDFIKQDQEVKLIINISHGRYTIE